MGDIQEKVTEIKKRIATAAESIGKSSDDIILVAATKMNNADRVSQAISAGVDACGENRVQELLEKYEKNAYDGAPLHFIGTLQTNKVKYIVGKVDLIHSVNSLKLAKEISRIASKQGIVQKVLIEINIGREETKSGILPEELPGILDELDLLPGLNVCGLMAIPPISVDCEQNKAFFVKMNELFVDNSKKKYDNISMKILSMGMSADFEQAIFCGSNMVRVGTGIFGARNYS